MPKNNWRTDNAAKARRAHERQAALRAIENPRALARARRIVRAALERGVLQPVDLLTDDEGAER